MSTINPTTLVDVIDNAPREHAVESIEIIENLTTSGVYSLDTLAHEIARVYADPLTFHVKFQGIKTALIDYMQPHASGPASILFLALDNLFTRRLSRKV